MANQAGNVGLKQQPPPPTPNPAPSVPQAGQAAAAPAIAPPVAPDPVRRSWLSMSFSGFEPDDTRSTLLRRWKGDITAIRNDGVKFTVPVASLQQDGPLRVGEDIRMGLARLESYKNCKCSEKVTCAEHLNIDPDGLSDGAA